MPSVRETIRDPNFYRMTPQDRILYIKEIDPNFKRLSPSDQMVFVTEGQSKYGFAPLKRGGTFQSIVPGLSRQTNEILPNLRDEFLARRELTEEAGLEPSALDLTEIGSTALAASVTGGMAAAPKLSQITLKSLPGILKEGAKSGTIAAATDVPAEIVGGGLVEAGHPLVGLLTSVFFVTFFVIL